MRPQGGILAIAHAGYQASKEIPNVSDVAVLHGVRSRPVSTSRSKTRAIDSAFSLRLARICGEA
jgi:hypothetical protein